MSNEFFRVARQEILSEISSLEKIFTTCMDDLQFHEKSKEAEKHLHKIKGLAPMMGQEKVGEIARICDVIAKHVIDHGATKDAYRIIRDGIERMNRIFNGHADVMVDDFKNNARQSFPQISGL